MAAPKKTKVPTAKAPLAKAQPAVPMMAAAPESVEDIVAAAVHAAPEAVVEPASAEAAPAAPAAPDIEPSPTLPIAAAPEPAPETPVEPAPAAIDLPSFVKKGPVPMVETIQNFTNQATEATDTASAKLKDLMGDVSARAKAAAEKGMKMATDAGAFTKANVEAVVESGKIVAEGSQALGRQNLDYVKSNFETATAAMKDLAAVKSPTEFFQLQSDYARRSFDTLIAQSSKNSEAMVKLFGDMVQPLSSRMSVAVESVKQAA